MIYDHALKVMYRDEAERDLYREQHKAELVDVLKVMVEAERPENHPVDSPYTHEELKAYRLACIEKDWLGKPIPLDVATPIVEKFEAKMLRTCLGVPTEKEALAVAVKRAYALGEIASEKELAGE